MKYIVCKLHLCLFIIKNGMIYTLYGTMLHCILTQRRLCSETETTLILKMDCEFFVRERSLEEDVELQCSTKKVKESTMALAFGSNVSYRDKLVGEMLGAFA